MGVGVGLRFVPAELRKTEARREYLCINGSGEGREAKLFEPGVNRMEGLADGLLRRPFPPVTSVLPSFILRRWGPVMMPSPPLFLLRIHLLRFGPEEQMIKRANLDEFPIFVDI